MAFDLAKFLARFIEEGREHCRRLSDGLLQLESNPEDGELLNALFRSAHTIKGSARMMKLTGINELAHRLEDLFDALRGGTVTFDPAVSDLLFKGVDTVWGMLDEVEAGNKGVEAPEEFCQTLSRAAAGESLPTPTAELGPESTATAAAAAEAAPAAKTTAVAEPETAATVVPPAAGPATTAAAVTPAAGQPAPSRQDAQPGRQEDARPTTAPAAKAEEAAPAPVKARMPDYLRVNSSKLDELVGLMGEIVSQHGKLKDHLLHLRELERRAPWLEGAEKNDERGHRRALRHELASMEEAFHLEEQLIGSLQNSALRLRMQPLTTIFDPLRRTVRDLARERGREVNFVVEGGETELDRKIIERIGDSLTHMIRNALDHGLEDPAERRNTGKPPRGEVRLLAEYDSAGVCITLEDDGRGIAVDKVREKALAKKLVDADTLAGMSEAEIINLIFLPGFSTSPIITDLSGRGVGMDVVRQNIVDELRGSVSVESQQGQGSRIVLRLPLNLAVFSLFMVRVGAQQVALPATSLVEIVAVPTAQLIKVVSTAAIRLRNQLLPVASLAHLLGVEADVTEADAAVAGAETGQPEELTLVIVRDGRENLGLIVDDVLGREEMVVKPLPAHLRGLRLLAGLTIGARDRIITVLHPPELIRQARSDTARGAPRPTAEAEVLRRRVLVVDDSLNTRELEKSILEAYGYEVDTAEDGEDALVKSSAVQYDLVVTDVEMPRLDGFSLTERLRGDERYRNTPIVIVTSREKEEDKRRGITVGADAYIVKGSFDQSTLLDTVRSLL